MERVLTLCNKLQDQLAHGATADELMLTVQMMQAELVHIKSTGAVAAPSAVSVNLPSSVNSPVLEFSFDKKDEKIVEVLQLDEAEVEAELEEIRRNVESRNKIRTQNKPPMAFDPIEETPTLTHQRTAENKGREVHEFIAGNGNASLNEKLKQSTTELGDSMKETAIKDLRKAIGVNDRFLFINELFRGDEAMYERSVKTINGFSIFPEAEYWIKREMKLKLGWDENNPVVQQFDQLVRRRFA